jgi:hypothetical protein
VFGGLVEFGCPGPFADGPLPCEGEAQIAHR